MSPSTSSRALTISKFMPRSTLDATDRPAGEPYAALACKLRGASEKAASASCGPASHGQGPGMGCHCVMPWDRCLGAALSGAGGQAGA